MKAKLIIALLIGLLIGSFLGGVLAPAVKAVEYNYQLDDIYSILSNIADDVSDIEYRVRQIYWNMWLIKRGFFRNET